MKYLLVVSIVCLSGFVGNLIAKNYVTRDLFFKEMINFFNYVKNNIGFKLTKIYEIFTEYEDICDKRFVKHIKLMKELTIENEPVTLNDFADFYFLNKEEKIVFVKFFKDFGKADNYVECANIDNFIKQLEELKKRAEDNRTKNEGLVYKLSIAIGMVVSILMI